MTDSEIVIGTYTDLSGVTAMWGVNNSNSWRMVFDQVNAAGGINGRKIKYIVEDNQYQVPRSVQAANKLINRDGVFIMVANGGTPMNNAVMPDQLAKGVANMFPLTSARSMYEPLNHLKFGLGSSYYDQIRAGREVFRRAARQEAGLRDGAGHRFRPRHHRRREGPAEGREHDAGRRDAAQADRHRFQRLGRPDAAMPTAT